MLDEPASGLDPRARIEVRELLKELKNMGKTILISSHILHELAQLCTRIGIIEAGQMVAQGPLDEIYRRLQLMRVVHVQLADSGDGLLERLRDIPGVESVDRQVDRIAIRLHEDRLSIEDLHDAIHGLGGPHPHVPARGDGHGNGLHEADAGHNRMRFRRPQFGLPLLARDLTDQASRAQHYILRRPTPVSCSFWGSSTCGNC